MLCLATPHNHGGSKNNNKPIGYVERLHRFQQAIMIANPKPSSIGQRPIIQIASRPDFMGII